MHTTDKLALKRSFLGHKNWMLITLSIQEASKVQKEMKSINGVVNGRRHFILES